MYLDLIKAVQAITIDACVIFSDDNSKCIYHLSGVNGVLMGISYCLYSVSLDLEYELVGLVWVKHLFKKMIGF